MIYTLTRAFAFPYREKRHCCKNCEHKKKPKDVKPPPPPPKNAEYDEHCRTLGLGSGADQEEVRRAFITLCKKYHPDSSSPDANGEIFRKIENSYRYFQAMFTGESWDDENNLEEFIGENDSVLEVEIEQTAPQHRNYPSYDGVGSGMLRERQHLYTQLRAVQAVERVLLHKILSLEHIDALSVQDRQRVNNTTTGFGTDRLVEDLIQDSMARGDFDDLPGAGRPLQRQSNTPNLDFITLKMNEIMIEHGFTPEWVTLGQGSEEDTAAVRKDLRPNIHSSGRGGMPSSSGHRQ